MTQTTTHRPVLLLLIALAAVLLSITTELFAASKPAKDTALVLAAGGQARAIIVQSKNTSPLERMAVRDLADYLHKATGAVFPVVDEGGGEKGRTCIFVGRTSAARHLGVNLSALRSQEWIIRTAPKSLILAGGDARGTLYAVYHFLEDIIGVRWWNPYEEYVPLQPHLVLRPTNLRGRPAFERRSLGGESITLIDSDTAEPFVHRNRVFAQGEQYGIGPGYFVHTFHYYMPNTRFEQHPKWFALVDGKRSNARNFGLCLTNSELQAAMLEKLRETVAVDRKKAGEDGTDPPAIYSVSQNDSAPLCQCPECTAVMEREVSQAGPLLEMVNYVAAGIKKEYPEVIVETLAYSATVKAPARLRPLDNVRIRVCLGARNIARPMEDSSNRDVLNTLRAWCKISNNVGLWLYSYSYGGLRGLPCPVEQFTAKDIRLFKQMGVRDVYFQQEYDFYRGNDWVFWMRSRLLENPGLDQEALLREFTDGYYGSAGKYIREYIKILDEASHRKNTYIWTLSPVSDCGYLDLPFLSQANRLFDKAEASVANSPGGSARVRAARLPVDRAILYLWPSLARASAAQDGRQQSLPFDRDKVLKRYEQAMEEQIGLRCVPKGHDRNKSLAFLGDELKLFNANYRVATSVPARFKDLPSNRVFDYPADSQGFTFEGSGARLAKDAESETGSAIVLPVEDGDLPLVTSLLGSGGQLPMRSIASIDIVAGRYAWYDLGSFTLSTLSGTQVCLGQNAQVKLAPQENGTYQVWASIKCLGPLFASDSADKLSSVSIDRIVLVKPLIEGNATIAQEWIVFAPLTRSDILPPGILKSIPGEFVVGDTKIKCQTAQVSDGRLDLAPMLGGTSMGRTALIFTTVDAKESGKVTFGFGADWWLQAWVDGELICDTTTMGNPTYPPSMADNLVTVSLSKGEHVLAVRFINGEASSLFAMGAGAALRRTTGR